MADLSSLEEYLNREFGALDIEETAERGKRRGRDLAAGVGIPSISAAPGLEPDLPELKFGEQARTDDSFFGEDTLRNLGAGAIDVAEMVTGVPEYAARQAGWEGGADFFQGVRGSLAETREGILEGLSPEALDRVGREILTLDPNKSMWRGSPMEVAGGIWDMFFRTLPATLTLMVPGAMLFRSGATAGAIATMGASEAGMSVGAIQNNIADEITAMDSATLAKESQRYASLLEQGMDEESAKTALIQEAQGAAPIIGGAMVGAMSLATGRLLKPVFAPVSKHLPGVDPDVPLGLGGRVARGFGYEAVQEGGQGASERLMENVAAKIYDENRHLMAGVGEAAAMEGFIGGLTGGAVAGVAGTRPRPPLPEPEEGAGGQLGLPGIGPAQPAPPVEEGPAPEGKYPFMGAGKQLDLIPESDVRDPVLAPDVGRTLPGTEEEVMGPTGEQQTLPLGIAGTVPLRERGPGQRTLAPDAIPPTGVMPDEADQPTAEPVADIQAQLDDMNTTGGRQAVYLSPEQRNAPRKLPPGAKTIPNWDGRGGTLIVKTTAGAEKAAKLRKQVQDGTMTVQEAIGAMTLAGKGKPAGGRYVVQLRNEAGNVARESMVATRSEALKLQKKWGKGAVIVTPEAAVQRRGALMEDELRTEDPAAVAEAQADLFEPSPQPLTAAEQTKQETEGFNVEVRDQAGELLGVEEFDSQEEAESRADILSKTSPDQWSDSIRGQLKGLGFLETYDGEEVNVQAVPRRTRAEPKKAGLSTTKQVPKRELKGPEEGPPKGMPRKEAVEPTPEREQYTVTGERTRKGRKEKFRETFETREEAVARQKELRKALGKSGKVDREITVGKTKKPKKPSTRRAEVSTKPTSVDMLEAGGVDVIDELESASEYTKEERAEIEPETVDLTTVEEFDETMSTKEIEALGQFRVEYTVVTEEVQPDKTVKVVQTRDWKNYKTKGAANAAATRLTKVAQEKAGPDIKVKDAKITVRTTPELQGVFEAAAQARADREPGRTAQEFIAANPTPSQKIQFIRREKAAQIRKKRTERSLRRVGTVTLPGGETVSTKPLTYEKVQGAETAAAKTKREARVKKARARLKKALGAARLFFARFNKSGPIGQYLDTQTNVDGSLTEAGMKFAKAKEGALGLTQLADSILADSENTSHAHADLAIDVAAALEKLGKPGILPEVFAEEFAVVMEAVDKQINRMTKQDVPTRTRKVMKDNQERAKERKNLERMQKVWGDDPIFRDIIAPIFRKFAEVMQVNLGDRGAFVSKAAAPKASSPRYYKPGEFEITNLRVALRSFRKMTQKYPTAEWYAPLREILEYYGFRFDKAGDLIVEEFSPSDALLGPAFSERYGISPTAAEGIDYTLKPEKKAKIRDKTLKEQIEEEKAEQIEKRKAAALERQKKGQPVQEEKFPRQPDEEQQANDDRKAVREIRTVNALIRVFKDKIRNSKTTIRGIQRAEQRLIRGLRKLGVWRDTSPTMGRIVITGGYHSKTIRLLGPRLESRALTRPKARDLGLSVRAIPMPRGLADTARRMIEMEDVDQRVEDEWLRARPEVNEQELEFFLENIKPVENNEKYLKAAQVAGDLLVSSGHVDGNVLLEEMAKNLDPNTFYGAVMKHLLKFDFGNVSVRYGRTRDGLLGPSDFPGGELGKFDPATNSIILNHSALSETKSGRVYGSQVLHTILHEFYHAGTRKAVDGSPTLKGVLGHLRDAARAEYIRQFGETAEQKLPYGLRWVKRDGKTENPVDELVTEAYTNEALRTLLENTKIEDSTAWRKFIEMVARIFNIDISSATTAWEAIVMTEEALFEYAGEAGARNADELMMLEHDGVLRGYAEHFKDRFVQSNSILQRVRDGGRNTIFNLMTMAQFAERYMSNNIIGKAMKKYYDAFRQRNAKAAEYLTLPQAVSHRWSQLEASNPEEATAVSQIMSEATLVTIDPRVPLEDKANAHLGEDLHDTHARLHAAYNELSDEGKRLMKDVLKYYDDSVTTETLFMMQNALRGILTGRSGSALTDEEFESKFSIEELKKLQTRKELKEALSEYMVEEGAEEMLDTIYKMSMLPRKHKGIYAPSMRYGDEVTYAEKQRDDVLFEDQKEAMAKRLEIVSNDPTLDAQVFENKEGTFTLRVWERAFIMGETVSEVEQLRQEMIDDPTNTFVREDFSGIQPRRTNEITTAIESNAALDQILKKLSGNPSAQAAIKNLYLRNLSEAAFRKHEIRRKNRKGVRYDTQHRNLALYAKQSSYYTAQLEFGHKMSSALKEMDDALRPVREDEVARPLGKAIEHLKDRDKLGHDLPTRSEFTKKSIEGTHFFMLASPSYWAINGSQPWMISLPTLAGRHGWMESAAQMWHFQKIVFGTLAKEAVETKGGLLALKKGKRARIEESFNIIEQIKAKLEDHFGADAKPYVDLLEHLRKNHIIDINVFNEMRDVATGKKQNTWDRTIDASRIMAHLTEVNNRVITALAAYQLEVNKSGAGQGAIEYAEKMVSDTQYLYSSENKPPLFQKYPLLFQFMQWPQHMYAHLIRNYQGMVEAGVMNKSEARSALLGLLGTHAAVGGIAGMMLQPIKWAVGLVMLAFGDDDEPYTMANALSGRTFDNLVARTAADLFGTNVSSVITKGLPMAAGVDLSARMSMGTFYFVDLRGDNAQSVLGSLVASFGGATLNQGLKFATGVGKIMDGDVYKGVETMMPKIFRDGLRAGRYYNEGLVNNAGDTVIEAGEMSMWNIIAQSFGFQPAVVSQHYSAQQAMKDAEQYTVGRRGDLMRKYRNADSSADRREVMREIRAFNLRNPQERISPSQIRSNIRAQKRREARYRRYGANISERKARAYEKYGEPYREE